MNDYLNTLKNLTTSKDRKIKVKENKEEIIMEVDIPEPKEVLQELFVQMGEINKMTPGPRKDMAILRLAIVAEYDAANLYENMAEETEDENMKKVLLEIANEEKAHIGEFEFLLEHIDPEHETNEEKGEEEVMDLTGLDAPPNE
jgi:hypothetical protein